MTKTLQTGMLTSKRKLAIPKWTKPWLLILLLSCLGMNQVKAGDINLNQWGDYAPQWIKERGCYVFYVRMYDLNGTDAWINDGFVDMDLYGSTNRLFQMNTVHQDGFFELTFNVRYTKSDGNCYALNQYYDEVQLVPLYKGVDRTIYSRGYYDIYSHALTGTGDSGAKYLYVYWYPNASYINKSNSFKANGYVELTGIAKDKGWIGSDIHSITSTVLAYTPSIQAATINADGTGTINWSVTNGNAHVNTGGTLTFQALLNGTWTTVGTQEIQNASSGTSNISLNSYIGRVTKDNLVSGMQFRILSSISPDKLYSPYFQSATSATFRAGVIGSNNNDVKIAQNNTEITISWTTSNPSGATHTSAPMQIEYSTDNSTWTTLSEMTYSTSQTAYSYTYKLPTSEREKGNVRYYYRVYRKVFSGSAVDLNKLFIASNSATIYTSTKKINSISASPVSGTTNLKVDWSLEPNGIWNTDNSNGAIVTYELTIGNNSAISVSSDVLTHTVNSLASCESHNVKLDIKLGGNIISSKTLEKVFIPSNESRIISNVTASKGYFSDYVDIEWTVPSDASDFDRFDIVRVPVNNTSGQAEKLLTQIIHSGLTNYSYSDNTMEAGVYYTYTVKGYKSCGAIAAIGASVSDIGFCQPYGTVSGRITYEGSQAVADVDVLVTGDGDNSRNRSLYFPNSNTTTSNAAYVELKNAINSLPLTVQSWVRLDAISTAQKYYVITIGHRFDILISYDNTVHIYLLGGGYAFNDVIIPKNTWTQISVAIEQTSETKADIHLYVNGQLRGSESTTIDPNRWASAAHYRTVLGTDRYFKDGFTGNLDEVRFWNVCLDSATIARNYNAYLSGKESGLVAYYRCDEVDGVNKLFDLSAVGNNFNKNDGTLSQYMQRTSDIVPSTEQLSNKTTTDLDGNYLINTVPFTSEGSLYKVIPTLGIHSFNPNSRPLFMSPTSRVHNGVDFTDVSSFNVSGAVYYQGTGYPVEGASLYVDGVVCSKDGEAIVTDANGKYTITVPIGDHFIQVRKQGHTFENEGRYPTDPNGLGNRVTFDQEVSDLNFYNTTLVPLVGRVVGGEIEKGKPLGLAQSTANIGQAVITLRSGYSLNKVLDGQNLTDATAAKALAAATPAVNSTASVGFGNIGNEQTLTITTDAVTGEFAVMVPPIMLEVSSVSIPSNNEVSFTNQSFSNINLTNSQFTYTDSIQTEDGTWNSFTYNASLPITYRVSPILTVKDKGNKVGAFGEKDYIYNSTMGNDTISVYEVNNDRVNYNYGHPIFIQQNVYELELHGYEQYVNKDGGSESEWIYDNVPLEDTEIRITNYMGSAQPVYIESGLNDDGKEVERGEIVEPTYETQKLDSLGKMTYRFAAGFPNIVEPYTRGLNIAFANNGQWIEWEQNATFEAYVFGSLPSGNNFVTSGPDQVLMVLRDPPGSNSNSFIEKGTSVSSRRSTGGSVITNNEISTVTSLGIYGTTIIGTPGYGIINEVGQKTDLEVGLNINYEFNNSNEYTTTTTTTERIATSDASNYVNATGDVFVGTATNILFGNARSVNFEKLGDGVFEIGSFDQISTSSEFSTAFNYTQSYIEGYLMTNLEQVRNSLLTSFAENPNATPDATKVLYLTNLSPDDERYGSDNFDKEVWGDQAVSKDKLDGPSYTIVAPTSYNQDSVLEDKVRWYNSQIALWKKTLADNEEAKVKVWNERDKYLNQNVSFSAGATYENSVQTCTGSTTTNTHTFETLAVLGLGTDFEINKTGVAVSARTETGGNVTTEDEDGNEVCTTFGYTLLEDGDDDALTIDVFNAPDGFGPIFRTRGGQTSCPYEDQIVTKYFEPGTEISAATMRIEWPEISVENAYMTDIPAGKTANYTLQLRNLSEVNEDIWYKLVIVGGSNPSGAKLTLGATAMNESSGFEILVRAGETLTQTLSLTQSRIDVLDYENIKIALASTCQSDETDIIDVIADTISISAHFVPSCSDLTLEINKRLVNNTTGDVLDIVVKDFDRNYSSFKGIRVQYKGESDINWRLAKEYVLNAADLTATNELLESSRIDLQLALQSPLFFDQNYQFRAITICNYGDEIFNESEIITVVRDMSIPAALGTPSPINGILTSDNDVSVLFNEDILRGQLNNVDNFVVQGVLNARPIDHNVAMKMQGTAASTSATINLANKDFAAEMWLNITSAGTILAHGTEQNGMKLAVTNDYKLQLTIDNATFTSEKTITTDKWIFLAFSYDNTAKTFTANYAQDASTIKLFESISVGNYNGNGRLHIGDNLNGAIHELSLWNQTRLFSESLSERSVTKYPSTTNLIGYWQMNEGKGTLVRDVARARNLTLSNVNDWYINNTNKAIKLNGNSYLAVNTSKIPVSNDENYMIEMWFNGAAQTNATLFSLTDSTLFVGFNAAGKLALTTAAETVLLSNENYLDNAWHHLALNVLRNGNAIVYVDGTVVKQMAASAVPALSDSHVTFGANRYRADVFGTYNYRSFFTGAVDEIRIWKATLTADIIRLNMYNRLQGNEAGLAAYYPFEKSTFDAYGQTIFEETLEDQFTSEIAGTTGADTPVSNAVSFTNEAPSLQAVRTVTNVSYSYVASERQIVFTINETAQRIEDCTLEFTVKNVSDVNGNYCNPISWTAYVNRNQLIWSDNAATVTAESLQGATFKATISNNSGTAENWSINNLPSWLSANAVQGILAPLSSREITFTVSPSTPIGTYEESIYLVGNNNISEAFLVNASITGIKPDWNVNQNDFEQSMSIIGQLQVVNIVSEDQLDLVAAFINDVCVGAASPVYYERYDAYYVMLDVYGNAADQGANVEFKVWDASTGITYPVVDGSQNITFKGNDLVGSMRNPFIWNAENKIEQSLSLQRGWNWNSLHVVADNMSVGSLFNSAKSSIVIVKDKSSFTQPTTDAWAGKLTDMSVGAMYKIQTANAVDVQITGTAADVAQSPVVVSPKWNWIGYNASYNTTVTDGLADLTPEDGDQIKGQSGFAIYQDYEWVGTLKTLAPGRGYMYYSNANETKEFTYPLQASVSRMIQRTERANTTFNPVAENEYPGNMTVIAVVKDGDEIKLNAEVGVFASEECRAAEMTDEDGYLFLTIAGDGASDQLNFKVAINGNVVVAAQTITYVDDAIYGSVAAPYVIQLSPTGITNTNADNVNVSPKKVNDYVSVTASSNLKQVSILDMSGRVVANEYYLSNQVRNTRVDLAALSNGVYVVIVETENGATVIERIIK